jgi:Lon protease-like protein
VTAYEEADDGRLHITLTGIARWVLEDEVQTAKPYRVCTVSYGRHAGDFDVGAGEADVDRENLVATLKAYLSAHDLSADWKAVAKASTETLVNSLALICPYGPEEKQALLEAPDLRARAEMLVALAEMELATGPEGSGSRLQ